MTTERRAYPRVKVQVGIELLPQASEFPVRAETADLSLSGCYVNMIFPLEIGTTLEARLRFHDVPVIVVGEVKTRDPQVGNGIHFLRMLPEDRHELKVFLDVALESSSSEVSTSSTTTPTNSVSTSYHR